MDYRSQTDTETLTEKSSQIRGPGIEEKRIGGILRKAAFSYRESRFGHWLPLIFADRINIWEGFLGDFKKGIIPNVFAVRGQFLARSAVKVLATAFVVSWILTGSRRKKRKKNRN